MKIKKTKFCSFIFGNEIPDGCKYCIKGEKLVLFVTGKCLRNCFYCSLSKNRKNKNVIFANEKKCKNIKEIIEEAKKAKALGAGITGGDPLLCLKDVIKYTKCLKREFGKKFHIHIYIPTQKVNEKNILQLYNSGIDEIRFHPNLVNFNKKDIEKIKIARRFKWKVGMEIPAIPSLEKNVFKAILELKNHLDFLNINEFEISDTNFSVVTQNYKINKDTYTIKNSKKSAFKILQFCKKLNVIFPIHFCTAKTKNLFQYRNRIKRYALNLKKSYEVLTEDYNLVRAELCPKNKKDKTKKVSMDFALKNKDKLKNKFRIFLVEQMPTSDGLIIQKQEI